MFWQAVMASRRSGAPGLGELAGAVPRMAGTALSGRYRLLTRGRLLVFVLAVAYLLSPVDLLPELALGPFGLIDDGAVAMWLAGALLVEAERFLRWERAGRPTVVGSPAG
ncbi:Protein of unknown function [Pseudonocardia thermophila]|jgi:Uncharacterized conserved protein|uniref:DUF1232 domain-containing protein n=2 Tax=Pseudonocardia thermophila TaxID=1848 RepID=A0A1M6R7P5_PSETH|nr:Protein of unknown function [Pseudonocardia thermophila]